MKILAMALLAFSLTVAGAFAADEKIDPQSFICAELLLLNTAGDPPLFESLQMDGYVAGKTGALGADPDSLVSILMLVSAECSDKPADLVEPLWEAARQLDSYPPESRWQADKTTCAEYAENPDDHSGFVVWLDGYNRGKGSEKSVLANQQAIDNFVKVCRAAPEKLILEAIQLTAQ